MRSVRFLTQGLVLAAVLAGCGDEDKESEAGVSRVALGTFTTDADGGVDVPVDVPDTAVSALLYCGPYTYDVLATAERITDPGGAAVYDFNDPAGTPMRVLNHDDMLPVLIPVSPDLPLTSGGWTVRVYVDSTSPATVDCNALYRIDEAAPSQSVDIRFVFVGVDGEVPGLNAAEGDTNEALSATVTRVGQLWADAGFSVGEISYEDFSGDVATYNSVDGPEELGNLQRTVSDVGNREIVYFLVSAITDADGATILGLAAGPPGLAAVGATSKSGVVASVGSLVDGNTDEMARILAHEGMHFMGLFHTSEKDGSLYDPIADTAECTTDADGNGTLSASECGGSGADNLMWWSASETSTSLSADQAWVVQRSAAAH